MGTGGITIKMSRDFVPGSIDSLYDDLKFPQMRNQWTNYKIANRKNKFWLQINLKKVSVLPVKYLLVILHRLLTDRML